jgi:hypothetical protein
MDDDIGSGESAVPAERWRHLVNAAFRLEETRPREGESLEAVLAVVDSALEVFTAAIDPIDDFEGYAVRRLLLALRGTLPGTATRSLGGGEPDP